MSDRPRPSYWRKLDPATTVSTDGRFRVDRSGCKASEHSYQLFDQGKKLGRARTQLLPIKRFVQRLLLEEKGIA